jgi:hypothetical protein
MNLDWAEADLPIVEELMKMKLWIKGYMKS